MVTDLKTVYIAWLNERRLAGMEPLSSDAHIHIATLIERFEEAQKSDIKKGVSQIKEAMVRGLLD